MNISAKNIIEIQEVYKYLEIKDEFDDIKFKELVLSLIEEVENTINPRYTYKIYSVSHYENSLLLLEDNLLLSGRSIKNHLDSSEKAILMAATLGIEAENLVHRKSKSSITSGIILDAILTSAIERICDIAQDNITKTPELSGYFFNSRFSPGYGDLPLNLQPKILNALNSYKTIGLTCTEDHILIPRKSVTAIFGAFKNIKIAQSTSCEICIFNNKCEKQKKGLYCGNIRGLKK